MRRLSFAWIAAGLLAAAFTLHGCGDDNGSTSPGNHAPTITSLTATEDSVSVGAQTQITCAAEDAGGDSLSYAWSAGCGAVDDSGAVVDWTAPASAGVCLVSVTVSDGRGGAASDSISITVGEAPPNTAPTIGSLAADPPAVNPGGTSTISCTAEDAEQDTLLYSWAASGGALAGSGAQVTWTAPMEVGTYSVDVAVTDSAGAVARDTVRLDVVAGTLLLQTQDGLTAVRFDGTHFVLHETTAPVEVLGTRIFAKNGTGITELDHDGSVLGIIHCSNPEASGYGFVMLPDAGYVLLSNHNDVMQFVGPDGTFLETVLMPEQSPEELQAVDGVLYGNRLIVSETGTRKLIGVDLATREATIFHAEAPTSGWIGALDHDETGRFYLCKSMEVLTFTEGTASTILTNVPAGNLTGVVVVGSYLYVTVNHEGALRRIHRETGDVELMLSGITYPEDIEYIPVLLEE